ELDRAGRGVDLIVDHGELAALDDAVVVGAQRVDRERARSWRSFGKGRVDAVEVLLRQVEGHGDRLELRDHDDGLRGSGAHDVAFVDLAHAGATVERRDDGGVIEHRLHVIDRGLVGLYERGVLRHYGGLRVRLLLVDGVGEGQPLVALEVELGIGERRLVLRLLGLRLIELRLVNGGIDARQHVALLDVLAFLEIDAENFAVDLRADGHGVERLHRADGVEIDRNVGAANRRGQHRYRAFGGKAAGTAGRNGRPSEDV